MGWLFYSPTHFSKRGRVDRKAEVEATFGKNYSVLKSCMVGSTYYGAVKHKDSNNVFAVVYLTKVSDGDFGYKDMDETCHPYCYDCPKSILDLLTPTDDVNANNWRKKCYEKLSKPKLSDLPIGTKIKFSFSDGEEVVLIKHEPAHQFKKPYWEYENRFNYMKKNHIPDNWEIVKG